jgi:hypothetical protein
MVAHDLAQARQIALLKLNMSMVQSMKLNTIGTGFFINLNQRGFS